MTAIMRTLFTITCWFGLLWISAAQAHKPSDSYLRLYHTGTQWQGQWDIALRDLQTVIDLDSDTDGNIRWGEVRAQHNAIAHYALTHLHLSNNHGNCTVHHQHPLIEQHADGAYYVLQFNADCPKSAPTLEIRYDLFFDIDRQHRGLLQIDYNGQTQSAVFSPEQPKLSLHLTDSNGLRQFRDYLREGVWHIAIGYDHILFLIALLLPVVLHRRRDGWQPVASLRCAIIEALKIVTAFTLAHSLTLSLAATGTISLPSRWVEAAIAASVLLAALDNLVPLFLCQRGWIALGFGLIHGFGFATVLGELGLPQGALLLPLLAFNLGVEVGQLLIVTTILPVLYGLRGSLFYQHGILGVGSLAAAAFGLIWLVERAGNVSLLPV